MLASLVFLQHAITVSDFMNACFQGITLWHATYHYL